MAREHPIRLRGGWEWEGPGAPPGGGPRVALPMAWPPGIAGPIRLVRRFHRPPIDPAAEALVLRLEEVPGLSAVWLNGLLLARPPAGTSALSLDLEPGLPDRNVLTLEIDPIAATGRASPWGAIALVVRPA
jgi:hypothetical protein